MRSSLLYFAAILSGVLTISGCGGGGGGGGLPTADNVLPAVVPPGSTDGIEDYLGSGGTWRVDLDGQVQAIALGSATLANALVYNSDLDQWIINVDGANLVLDYTGGGYDNSATCTTRCALFAWYDDDPVASQYGTFGYVLYVTNTKWVDLFGYAGLKTAAADMPAGGTGTYSGGNFSGAVNYTNASSNPDFDYLDGTVDITANFTASTVAFASTGTGVFNAGSTYTLSGSAVISGNTYSGTVTGSYNDGALGGLTLDASGAGSSLSGAFYGPTVDETAGVLYATSAAADPNWGEIAGGFWAPQTNYVP